MFVHIRRTANGYHESLIHDIIDLLLVVYKTKTEIDHEKNFHSRFRS